MYPCKKRLLHHNYILLGLEELAKKVSRSLEHDKYYTQKPRNSDLKRTGVVRGLNLSPDDC